MPRLLIASLISVLAQDRASELDSAGFARALDRVNSRDYVAALSEASRVSDPAMMAQATMYALHQAGDLDGALRTGIQGLEANPDDAWTLERVVDVAISLRERAIAARWLPRLQASLGTPQLDPVERTRRTRRIEEFGVQISLLGRLDAERDRASNRAKWTLALGLLGGVGILLLLHARWRSQ